MGCLKAYEVPPEFANNEQSVTPQFLNLLRARPLYRRNQSEYIKAYTAMIHLEESAHGHFLAQFNVKDVQLKYSGTGREFVIRKTVGRTLS